MKDEYFTILKILKINILIFLILLFILELVFGKWIKSDNFNCHYVLCDAKLEFEHQLFGYKYTVNYSKDRYGLRGGHAHPSEIDVLVIGGSTSDQKYLSNNDTWDYLLQEKLKDNNYNISIANAGINGQTLTGHIWSLENWLNTIEGLNPKYILFYIGINDIFPNLNPQIEREFIKTVIKNDYFKYYYKIISTLRNNSAIYNLLRKIRGVILAIDFNLVGYGKNIFETEYKIEPINDYIFWDLYNEEYLSKYIKIKLDILLELTDKLGAIPIFVPQRTAWWQFVDGKVLGSEDHTKEKKLVEFGNKFTTFWSVGDMGIAQIKFGEYIINYCRNLKILCFDGVNKININVTNTYDLTHTNSLGSKEISDSLFPFMVNIFEQK